MYSGNGRLLQGDIYRRGVDGRAAWREIKSDCLGKSEPPPISTVAFSSTPRGGRGVVRLLRRLAVLHTSHETKNTKNIRIGALTDLCRPRRSLLLASVSTHSGSTTATSLYYSTHSPPSRSISRTAIKRRDASSGRGNKLSPNTSGIFPCLFLPAAKSRISEIALPPEFRKSYGRAWAAVTPSERFNFAGSLRCDGCAEYFSTKYEVRGKSHP